MAAIGNTFPVILANLIVFAAFPALTQMLVMYATLCFSLSATISSSLIAIPLVMRYCLLFRMQDRYFKEHETIEELSLIFLRSLTNGFH